MSSLHPELLAMLSGLRKQRGFAVQEYIDAKCRLLNDYMSRSGLKAVVVGVSGGVDSALVLALVTEAAKQPGSPIKRVVAALLPYSTEEGTSGQESATTRGEEVARAYGAQCVVVDMAAAQKLMADSVDSSFGVQGSVWAHGQLASYLRTPVFFYFTSLLAQEGLPAVLIGTTNRDEGGYIGFFGKAGDAMVDLQLISDIHKSEVYAASALLGVPKSVMEVAPTGDIYDGRNDEQLIGAPYDFIELYSLLLSQCDEEEQELVVNGLNADARSQFDRFAARLRQLNRENAHKYLGGSVAVNLDVYERAVPGGWRAESSVSRNPEIDRTKFVNQFDITPDTLVLFTGSDEAASERRRIALQDFGQSACVVDHLLSAAESERLVADLDTQHWAPVGVNGMLKGFDPKTDTIGSWRASLYNEQFAEELWKRIAPHIARVRVMDERTPADWNGDPVWRAVGINPLMRFIRYSENGLLVPHYDAPYDYHDGKRTLMSLVLYLTDGTGDGGNTRFIVDPQRHLPLAERDYRDWNRQARPGEILFQVSPSVGAALVFDHRILHDSEQIRGDHRKIIMRTDIVFERCGLGVRRELTHSRPLGMPETVVSPESSGIAATSAGLSEDAKLLEKAKRDPFYGPALPLLGSLDALMDAGFFDDGSTDVSDALARAGEDWLMTPVDKIRENIAALGSEEDGKELVVLVSTGAYCPLHDGHVKMMESAKRHLEVQGKAVVGGYFSAGHDLWVGEKNKGEALDALHRVRLIEEKVASSAWLMADPWESLGVERALNFTDVVARLERYLSRHVHTHRPLHVVYVFGSDNARFAAAFAARGRCVCVLRPGYQPRFEMYKSRYGNNPRLQFSELPGIEISSTDVRKGRSHAATGNADRLYQEWTANMAKPSDCEPELRAYYLRNEGAWAMEPWLAGRDPLMLAVAWSNFRAELAQLLIAEHERALSPDRRIRVGIKHLNVVEQCVRAAELIAGNRCISLDPCIPGDYTLDVSRTFELSAGVSIPNLSQRPGSSSISEQLALIPAGRYVLFDDDVASGFTMKRVQALLPDKVELLYPCSLTKRGTAETEDMLDIVDSRDFLAGARLGGLAVRLPNSLSARAPYTLPYVSPSARVSTPLSRELEFSLAIWRLNETFFTSVSPSITLEETDPTFRRLMTYVGFALSTPMKDISRWHIERLEQRIRAGC